MSAITRAEDEAMDDIAIIQIHAGDGDGAELVFEYNGKRIAVTLSPTQLPRDCHKDQHEHPIEDHLIQILDKAATGDIDDIYDDIIDEVLDVILDAGKPTFSKLAPLSARGYCASNQALHSLLYPETFNFSLKTIDGKPTVVSISPDEAYVFFEAQADYDMYSDFQIETDLPQHLTSEICVQESFLGSGAVKRVLVNNQQMLCKARARGLLDPGLERELICLQKIEKAFSSASRSIQVPHLLGYVKHAENGHVVGLLREWIPSSTLGCRLGDIDISTIPKERRDKWAAQIRKTVGQLHEIGVVWGDGKASNVIIDKDDIAWLIDFGGGWTDGWVDEKLADTVEGDEQAVTNIMKFLNTDLSANEVRRRTL